MLKGQIKSKQKGLAHVHSVERAAADLKRSIDNGDADAISDALEQMCVSTKPDRERSPRSRVGGADADLGGLYMIAVAEDVVKCLNTYRKHTAVVQVG